MSGECFRLLQFFFFSLWGDPSASLSLFECGHYRVNFLVALLIPKEVTLGFQRNQLSHSALYFPMYQNFASFSLSFYRKAYLIFDYHLNTPTFNSPEDYSNDFSQKSAYKFCNLQFLRFASDKKQQFFLISQRACTKFTQKQLGNLTFFANFQHSTVIIS